MSSYIFQGDNITAGSDSHGLNSGFNETTIASNEYLLEQYNNEVLKYKLPAIIYTIVMMSLGLPGNMLVFYVYFFKWRRSTSRMFILFLAALDMVNCATTFPIEIIVMRYSLKLDHPFLCKVARYSTYVLNSSSALILLGIAIDRFKRICKPYQGTFSEKQSKYICIVSIVCSLCMPWPALVLYGTREVDLGNATGYACLLQNKFDSTPYPMIFFGVMITTTMLLFAALAALYYLVGKQIYVHRSFKLKNCTHVQRIEDEKSVTVRPSEKSTSDKPKLSNHTPNNDAPKALSDGVNKEDINGQLPDTENCDAQIIVEEVSNDIVKDNNNKEYNEDKLRPYQLGIPAPCVEDTSCGLLDIPSNCQNNGSFSEKSLIELSTRDISFDSRVSNGTDKTKETDFQPQQSSPQRRKQKQKRKTKRVRYMLVRGASTMHASGRVHCSNCLTVRIGRSTLMLFLITLAYVLSFLPFYTIVVVRQTCEGFITGMSTGGTMAYEVFLRSYILSSAINPFIYSFCNIQFREYCKDLFSRLLLHRSNSSLNSKFRRR